MKRFFIDIIVILIFTYVLGEFVTRIFNLRSQNMDYQIEGVGEFYSNMPYKSGNFVFGKPPSLYIRKFQFNDMGFNTPLNYIDFDDKKINVAFLGDSFVESLHVDYDDSFSSILMKKSSQIQSYEFGFHEYNIEDYIWLYNTYNLKKFDYVFLIIDTDDIKSKPNRKKFNSKKESFRKLYNTFHFFNFLNRNHNIIRRISNMLSSNKRRIESVSKIYLGKNHKEFLTKENILILPRNYVTYKFFEEKELKNLIKLNYELELIDYGEMDEHWNIKGREMVIESLFPYINGKKKNLYDLE